MLCECEWAMEKHGRVEAALAGLNYMMILNLLRIERTIRCAFIQFQAKLIEHAFPCSI